MLQITKEKYDRVVAMSRAGLVAEKICEFTGISRATVYRIRKIEGIAKPQQRNDKISQALIDKILQMGRDGYCIAEISRACGISETSVSKRLKKAGIEAVNGNDKISKDTIDKIIQMGRDGFSSAEIARACGISQQTVNYRLKKAGLWSRHGDVGCKISQDTIEKILQMGRDGCSNSEIARACGVSKKTVRTRLDKAGIRPIAAHPDHKNPETDADPMTVPGMKKYKVIMELSNGKGSKLTREVNVTALSERDAIISAAREVAEKYTHHYKVVKSVQMIEEKAEEKPVEKKSGSRIKMASMRKTFEIDGINTGFSYYISIEKDVVRLSIDHEKGLPGTGRVPHVEFKLSDIDAIREEISEVLALIGAEETGKGA